MSSHAFARTAAKTSLHCAPTRMISGDRPHLNARRSADRALAYRWQFSLEGLPLCDGSLVSSEPEQNSARWTT